MNTLRRIACYSIATIAPAYAATTIPESIEPINHHKSLCRPLFPISIAIVAYASIWPKPRQYKPSRD